MAIDTSWVWTGGGLAVLGIIALVVSMFLGKQSGAPRGLKTLFVVGGVTLLLLGVALTFGIGGLTSTPQTTAGTARYEVTVTAGDSQNVSNIAIDDTARTIQVRIQCSSTCSTFDYSSGTAELNFTVGRADTGTQDSIFDAKVVSVGLVSDSSGDGTTHPIVATRATRRNGRRARTRLRSPSTRRQPFSLKAAARRLCGSTSRGASALLSSKAPLTRQL
jgi:hypothetical protein